AGQIIPILAVGVAALGVRFFGPGAADYRRESLDVISAMVLAGLLGWKLGPLLSQTRNVLDDPRLLLFAPGGTEGAILGVLAVAGMLLWRWLRAGRPRVSVDALRNDPRVVLAGLTIAVAIGLGVLFQGVALAVAESESERAPAFSLPGPNGGTVALEDHLNEGEVILVNFWATWCVPCRAEAEIKNRIASEFEGEVTVLGINLTSTESGGGPVVNEYIDEWDIEYPVLLDTDGRTASRYNVRGTPTTVFLSPDGMIRDRHYGAMSEASARRAIVRARNDAGSQ
ncbi:MAG: redoxin domain-containing protein, partial [Spirochaetota bacterium]